MAELAPRVESTPSPVILRGFRWYVAGVAAWFAGFGMQQVLFSWLVVGELAAEARWVGVAQSASPGHTAAFCCDPSHARQPKPTPRTFLQNLGESRPAIARYALTRAANEGCGEDRDAVRHE